MGWNFQSTRSIQLVGLNPVAWIPDAVACIYGFQPLIVFGFVLNNQAFINLFVLSDLIIFFKNMLVQYKYYYDLNLGL